jgi:hypothetical protein
MCAIACGPTEPLLLQVKVTELTAGGLDDANLVGPRVVPIESKKIRQYTKTIPSNGHDVYDDSSSGMATTFSNELLTDFLA